MNKARFEICRASNDEWYFVLKAANNEVVLISETYKSKQSAEKTVNAIKFIAKDAPIVYKA